MIENGRLLRVLADWSPTYPGFHLYYSAGAPLSPAVRAVRAVVDALKAGDRAHKLLATHSA